MPTAEAIASMPSAALYRVMAEECLVHANVSRDENVAQRWRKLARDYKVLAAAKHLGVEQDNFRDDKSKAG